MWTVTAGRCRKAIGGYAEKAKRAAIKRLKSALQIHSPSAEWMNVRTGTRREEQKTEFRLSILGSPWTLRVSKRADDPGLQDCDGYTDRSSRTMVVRGDSDGTAHDLENYEEYIKTIKRHEIVHAFLYESGLGADYEHPRWGHDETAIDWIAIQFPKMLAVFQEAEAL